MATTIRPATVEDVPQFLSFIRALAAYERAPDEAKATEADLLRDGFGPNPFYFCLIAEFEGQPAGFALYFFNYSTWLGRPGLYLEDLFVQPEFRGLGIGKALLKQVLDWNTPAIDFYRAMGAEFLDEWRNVRLSGQALERLAGVPCDVPTEKGTPAPTSSQESLGAPSFRRPSGERVGDRESQSTSEVTEASQ
jgi:GNAT superfamily N-acetyltransferase